MSLIRPKIILMLLVAIAFIPVVLAEDLDSNNYTLKDPEIGSIVGETNSNNYSILTLSGDGIDYSQVSSSLYKIGSGHGYTFMANVPGIKCFETSTNSGNTSCDSMPSSDGLIGECGNAGCYDRAMVQLNSAGNPSDTLYTIELSYDDWNTVYVLDGTTHFLKAIQSKTISDYLTLAAWTQSPWQSTNIRGLIPNTEYKVRARALHGDFTESPASPTANVTTTIPTAVFDIDIGDEVTDENNAPYLINIGGIAAETYKFSTPNNIIIEFETNAQSGASVYVQDTYSGLRSTSTLYLLQSNSEDLSLLASGDGFGMAGVSATQESGSIGKSVIDQNFDLSGTNVGQVQSSVSKRVVCSLISEIESCSTGTHTWINGGHAIYTVGARASISAKAVSDYEDTLTFTLIGAW